MFARKGLFSSIGRAGAVATVVAVALTAVEPSMAFAGSATSGKGVTASTGTSDATDISARRRYYRWWRWCRGSGGLCRHRRHGDCDRGHPEPPRLLL